MMRNLFRSIFAGATRSPREKLPSADGYPSVIPDLQSTAAERGWNYRRARPSSIQSCQPSMTIAEESLDRLRSGPAYLRPTPNARSPETIERAELYYSHLSASTRYPIGETFICEVPQAILAAPAGVIFTADSELLLQSSFDRSIASRAILPPSPLDLPGRWLSLLSLFTVKSNYAHWLMDSLPKLSLLDPSDHNFKVIIPAHPASFIIDSLRLLGIESDRILEMPATGLRVETLIFSHAAQRSGVPSAPHLLALRERLLQSATGQTFSPSPSKRLYISRARSARAIVNELELLPILRDFGFDSVFGEDLDFPSQIRLFSEANVIAGAHGAGIFNHLFCNQESTVVEIFNRDWWDHAPRKLATLLNHRHWHLFGQSMGATHTTQVDPRRLSKLLTYALTSLESSQTHDSSY